MNLLSFFFKIDLLYAMNSSLFLIKKKIWALLIFTFFLYNALVCMHFGNKFGSIC